MRFTELDREGQDDARTVLSGMYLHGMCVAFAIAIKRKLRYPELIGMWKGNELIHAGTRNPREGIYFDARGFLPLLEFVTGWHGTELRPNTEEELLAADPKITEDHIRRAEYDLELMFPEHCKGVRAESYKRLRVRKFVEDLERLAVRHGLYLRSSLPAGWDIVIEERHGDEQGYEVKLSPTGSMHLNRIL